MVSIPLACTLSCAPDLGDSVPCDRRLGGGLRRRPRTDPSGHGLPGRRTELLRLGEINQCTGSPQALANHSACQPYETCAAGVQTTLCTAVGGSHCGNYQSLGIVDIAWEMFQKKSLP